MSHIFISYSTKTGAYALKLADKLRQEGFDVWIDNAKLRASDDWWRSIMLALTPNWEIFVSIQIEDVRGGKLPSVGFYETLAKSTPRRERKGENVTDMRLTMLVFGAPALDSEFVVSQNLT